MSDRMEIYGPATVSRRWRTGAVACLCLALGFGSGFYLGSQSAKPVVQPVVRVQAAAPVVEENVVVRRPEPVPEFQPEPVPPLEPAMAESLSRKLLAWLPFDKDLADHSNHNLPVGKIGSVTVEAGAARFDGSSYLALPTIRFDKRPVCVALWIKPLRDDGGYALVMQKESFKTNHYFHTMVREGARPYLGFYEDDLLPGEGQIVRLDTWTHLVFQFADGRQKIFMNGTLIAERRSRPYDGTHGATTIGCGEPVWRLWKDNFNGWMSDLRIYDGALTDAQIEALATQTPRRPGIRQRAVGGEQAF